jgi:transcriptional regulator with XRE-family HTH domain
MSGPNVFSEWLDQQLFHGQGLELARFTGVSPGMISHWRQGYRIPPSERCQQIAAFLNVEPAFVEGLAREARIAHHRQKIARKRARQAEAMAATPVAEAATEPSATAEEKNVES